jgi:hypothetical protein
MEEMILKKNIKYMILTFILLFIIFISIKIKQNSVIQVKDWYIFRSNMINNYTFIDDINLDHITPPELRIIYSINREIDMNEIDKIVLTTKKYIFNKEVFKDLEEFHKDKYKYSFGKIQIRFVDNQSDFIHIVHFSKDKMEESIN